MYPTIIFIIVLDCESLIRKMLVLEPNKRFIIAQIKKHRWMQMGLPPKIPTSFSIPINQPIEQILRLMQSLGIDSTKTRDVRTTPSNKLLILILYFLLKSIRLGSYDHHAAIYYLLLDKLRNQLDGGDHSGVREVQRRRPSSVAEQAMRKLGRASTSDDCRRVSHYGMTTPHASNNKLNASVGQSPNALKISYNQYILT